MWSEELERSQMSLSAVGGTRAKLEEIHVQSEEVQVQSGHSSTIRGTRVCLEEVQARSE